jgi:hypothetical protein
MSRPHTRSVGGSLVGQPRRRKRRKTPPPNPYKRARYQKPRCGYPNCTKQAQNIRTSYCNFHCDGDLEAFQELCEYLPKALVIVTQSYLEPKCQGEICLLHEYMNDIGGHCGITSVEVNDTAKSVPELEFPVDTCPLEVVIEWMKTNNLYDIKLELELRTSMVNWEKVEKTPPPFHFSDEMIERNTDVYYDEYKPYAARVREYINKYQCADAFSWASPSVEYVWNVAEGSRILHIVFHVTWECFQELRPKWKSVGI